MREEEMKKGGQEVHSTWKGEMLRLQKQKVQANDAILVINMEKNSQKNYIGGATFLEIYMAFELGNKIYIYNPLPNGLLHDELIGMQPVVINGNLDMIK